MLLSTLPSLAAEIARLRADGKTIVWTNGCFDLMHPGHIETFRVAKSLGDIVVVGINSDASPYWATKPGRPINSEKFRAEMVASLRYVDIVYLYDGETPIEPIAAILPDVLLKGGDYDPDTIVGAREVRENGGRVVTVPIVGDYSTTQIVKKVCEVYGAEA
ncbi:MAG TPA: adenylyltransferase/cytidyltransferase family protein [bacterium]|nr:adenylyltransferase/cytidyltransferase family protein [bacterium]